MATTGGPDIERDGLVFGYDTSYGINTNSISSRFYPGEPTINYGENSMSVYGSYWTNIGREGNTHTIYRHAGASSSTIAMASGIFSGLPVGTVTTISGYLYKNGVPYNTTSNTISTYNTTISHETRDDGYFRYTQSLNYTNGSWNIHAVLISSPVQGDTIILKDLQMEVNTHSTPYLKYNTSRSSTASLIDLKKTTDIDVSNVSFDSTGQPVFDGTDDYINMGDLAIIKLGTNFTIEAVVKPEQDKWMYFFHKGYGQNNSLAWGRHSTGDNWFFATMINSSYQYSYMGTATLNQYCYLVASYDGANLRLYENGDLQATVATTHDMMTSTQPLGIGGPGRYWNGEIPVTKVYNRALSAEEVQQNFNAYKNRFNI